MKSWLCLCSIFPRCFQQVYSRSSAPEMKRHVANLVAKNMLEHDVSPLIRRPRWATVQEVSLPFLFPCSSLPACLLVFGPKQILERSEPALFKTRFDSWIEQSEKVVKGKSKHACKAPEVVPLAVHSHECYSWTLFNNSFFLRPARTFAPHTRSCWTK